jgi:hypothetical protein
LIRIILTALLLSVVSAASAADLEAVQTSSCLTSQDSQILSQHRPQLIATITKFRDDAKAASESEAVVFSKSAAFDWAVAATVQCNVALGYLNGGNLDKSSATKCDCFHGRFLSLQ